MLKNSHAFSGFSVDDLSKAKDFYGTVLALDVSENPMGLNLKTKGNNDIFVYEKSDHKPATYTMLNFPVESVKNTVAALKEKGVTFERYEGMTDDDGIAYGKKNGQGPDIAWFKDPAGNILSVLEN